MIPRLRSALDQVPAYAAGKPPVGFDGETFKLSSNENPYSPLPGVLESAVDAAGRMNRYPDMAASALTERLADRFGVAPEQVATGTGSVGVLQQLVQATCGTGDEVLFAWRSFEAYPIVARVNGATPVAVPLLADERHDLGAMAAAITPSTRMVLVCTPNNPTGPAVRQAELEAFLATVPGDVLVVVDEAYVEFVRDPYAVKGVGLLADHDNVMVLRTFSKAYGLAGLRVGFAIGHAEVASALRKTAVPFGVSTVAQEAAIASLDAEQALAERVEQLVIERARVVAALTAQGWTLPSSDANFVWLRLGERSPEFAAACDAVGVSVRPYGAEGVRVTIGEGPANDRVVEVAAGFLPEG